MIYGEQKAERESNLLLAQPASVLAAAPLVGAKRRHLAPESERGGGRPDRGEGEGVSVYWDCM